MKKALVVLLALAMAFSLLAAFPFAVLANDEGEAAEQEPASKDPWDDWDGSASIAWYLDAIAEQTEENPATVFHLKTAADLAGFSYLVNAFYVDYTTTDSKTGVVTAHQSCYDGLYYDTATGQVLGFGDSGNEAGYRYDYAKLGLNNPKPQQGDEAYGYTTNNGIYRPIVDISTGNATDGSAYIAGENFKEKTVYLLADLIMNDTANFATWGDAAPAHVWMPIGGGRNVSATFPHFEGFFRGEGHTIEGLYFSAPEDMNVTGAGLFGHVARSSAAKVQDVIVEKSFFRCSSQVAGLCGRTDNALGVTNCHVRNTVIHAYDNNAAGVVGSIHGGSLTLGQCSATDIFVDAPHTVGALAASANYQSLLARDCLTTGEIHAYVKGDGTGGWDIGIVVGRIGQSTVTVKNLVAVVKNGSSGEEMLPANANPSKCYYVDLFEANGEVRSFKGTTARAANQLAGNNAKNNLKDFDWYDEETNPTGVWHLGKTGEYPYLVNAGHPTATEDVDPGSSGEGGAGHDHDNPVEAKAATCTEAGNVFYYDCSICGYPVDEYGFEIDPVIPATGHKLKEKAEKAATATADGMQAHYQCEKCGAYFDANKNEVRKSDLLIPKTGTPN